VLGGSIVVIAISAAVNIGSAYAASKFTKRVSAELAAKLLRNFLSSSLENFYARTFPEFSRSIHETSARVSHGIMGSLTTLISRVWLLTLILLIIFVTQPSIAVSMITVLGISYAVVFLLVKPAISNLSLASFDLNKDVQRHTQNSYHNYRDIILADAVRLQTMKFRESKLRMTEHNAKIEILGVIPRHLFEALGLITAIAIAFFVGRNDITPVGFVSSLAIFVLAGYRLLPAIQQIYQAGTRFLAAATVFKNVKADFASGVDCRSGAEKRFLRLDEIEFRDVSYIVKGNAILDRVFLRLPLRGLIHIDGQSGSGKTTLIECALGLRIPAKGKVLLDGHDLSALEKYPFWEKVGYCSQWSFILDASVKDNILGFLGSLSESRFD
jgi:HlyD family secretion protein